MTTATVLTRLASVAHSVRFDDLPPPVVQAAKTLVLDTLGCAFGGFGSDVAAAVRDMADEAGGHPHATVIGTGAKTSMALATLANGTMLRYQDSNDYYFARDPAHPSGNLAAALAVGERVGCSGRTLIAALVAAYEVHLRFADTAGQPTLWGRGWHHGTNSQFSTAALASRLLDADGSRPLASAHAMAIAGSHHNTLAQLQSGDISMIKASAEAWVAKGGVEAAMLAARGVTGPLALVEGKHGWADSVAGQVDVAALVAPIEGHFRLSRVCIKPYPAVATAIAAVSAAISLHARCRNRLHEVVRIVVQLPTYALGTPSGNADRRYPSSKESADHSFYFCVAVALLDGACGEDQFTPQKIAQPSLRPLLACVELQPDPALDQGWPGAAGGAVSVHLRDGAVLHERRQAPPGHPDNPLTEQMLAAKFHGNADPVLGRMGAERLRRLVDSLEDCPDLREFTPALAPAVTSVPSPAGNLGPDRHSPKSPEHS